MLRAPALALAVLLAGCAAPSPSPSGGAEPPVVPSFDVALPERLTFAMPDGVELVATLWRPEGLEAAPVVLHAQPYASMCQLPGAPFPPPCTPPTDAPFWLEYYNGLPRALVEAGFAYVDLNVRGTGPSGGCLDLNGPTERADLVRVVEELAVAPWSTGAVGMLGLSYMGTTPFVALGERPSALKAVVAGGVGTNEYYFWYTPQGATPVTPETAAWLPTWFGSVVLSPQLGGGARTAPDVLARHPERLCPGVVEAMTPAPAETAADDRRDTFFLERRHLARLRDVDAGVLVVQSFEDRGGGMQVEQLWPALGDAPRAFVLGDWGHEFPTDAMLEGSGLAWHALALGWFDHFLRDGPPPEVLGKVRYKVHGGGWREADAWPAVAASALHVGAALTETPGSGDLAFAGTPQGRPCEGADGDAAVALSDPLDAPLLLAGNAMAWLQVRTDASSAVVAVDLWDVPGDDLCEGVVIASGAADLRFLDDPFHGKDVPSGTPLGVRVDLYARAWEVPAGHRLGLSLSSGGAMGMTGRGGGTVTVLAEGSHLLLPTGGAIGVAPPDVAYPPVPLGPDWAP